MKSNFFTHKFLPILSILILISFVFINNGVFAYETSYNSNKFYISDEAYEKLKSFSEYSDDYNYFVIFWGGHYEYYFCPKLGNEDIKMYFNGFFNSSDTFVNVHFYSCDSDFNIASSSTISWKFSSQVISDSDGVFQFLTNFDVYTDNTYTQIFFHLTPLTLAGILEANNPVEIFQSLMKKLVVSLLVCLIGFLSLRKGWTFLKQQMRES